MTVDIDEAQLEALTRSLTNITPGPDGIQRIEEIRTWSKGLGTLIIQNCPYSRERSLALTHLEETVMWAVKSIVVEDA